MTTTPISLQDLRRRIYVTAKADKTIAASAGTAWLHERLGLFGDYRVRYWTAPESAPSR